ncbi:DUF1521 domain-containing protein [Aquincola sp. J276]|uniref:DUF1521 domain-containing protein n=1 Tax=Aquincola sp. J276 TaxID=2898432 RepID=UPI0021516EE9|nr:DUF1521 domain-containing protein [Aquincola sp. J276]MCR5867134.1 DUF1521 domain-containing protein [Aquincola sp. J276]
MNLSSAGAQAAASAAYRAADAGNPTHAATTMVGGKVQFENDRYRITMDDNNQVHIANKATGEDYRIWGDPHVEIDGRHAFDFWGTTTFALDDGTKVTIETTPWQGSAEATVSSKVTITNDDYAVHVSGIDSNTRGDLKFEEATGWGRLADLAVDDGNVLHENRFGSGFLALDGSGQVRRVDQQYIHETDLKKGGALQAQYAEAFRQMGGLMSILFLGALAGGMEGQAEARSRQGFVLTHRPETTGWFRAHAD